jgi:type IV secretory pathway TrbD component
MVPKRLTQQVMLMQFHLITMLGALAVKKLLCTNFLECGESKIATIYIKNKLAESEMFMMAHKNFPIYYGLAVFVVLFTVGYGTGVGGSITVNFVGSALLAVAASLSFWMMRKYGSPKE